MATFLNNHKIRGLRNNNPGNLIRTSIAWQGKIPFPQSKDTKFEQFQTIELGLRAMFKDLINDINKGKNTITKLINEYAPPHENNTKAYINSVSKSVGLMPDTIITKVDAAFLLALGRAILKVELGTAHAEITDTILRNGISLLGTYKLANVSVDTKKTTSVILAIVIPVVVFFYTYVTLTTILTN